MLKKFGSNYGGWTVEVDLISDNDIILAAGIGDDISFEEELFSYNNTLKFVGLDPNGGSRKFFTKREPHFKSNYIFLNKALSAKTRYDFSTCDNVICKSLNFQELLDSYDFSLVKLDIEGSEYECLESISNWHNVKQIAVEFHHWVPSYNKTIEMTYSAINKLKKDGFRLVFHKINIPERKIQECLFIRENLTNLPEILL